MIKHHPRSRRRARYMYQNAHMDAATFSKTFGGGPLHPQIKITATGIPYEMISVLVPYCTRRFRAKIRKHYAKEANRDPCYRNLFD